MTRAVIASLSLHTDGWTSRQRDNRVQNFRGAPAHAGVYGYAGACNVCRSRSVSSRGPVSRSLMRARVCETLYLRR